MRRAPIVLAGTIAGTAAVLGFHARTPDGLATAKSPAATAPPARTSGSGSSSASSASSSSPSSSAKATTTVTGDAIATRYGNAQVEVTITGGRITAITAVQLQANEPKSVQISSSAEPALRQEALQAQKAAVDAVSGATVTSASYEASLQSALDKAHFKAADGTRASSTIPEVEEHDGDGGPGDGGPGGPPGGSFPGGG